jgi:hypothetical protein
VYVCVCGRWVFVVVVCCVECVECVECVMPRVSGCLSWVYVAVSVLSVLC